MGGARAATAPHRRLPLPLRADARAAIAAVSDPARGAEEVGHALPRLGHPRQDTRAARLREEGGRGDRRQLRRDPLGARGRGDPARDRPRRDRACAAVRAEAAADRPRALLPPAQGQRARDRRRGRARRRPRARRGPPPRRGVRALPRRRHRRRPAERGLVRALRDRGDGAWETGRHVPARRGGPPHRGGLRNSRADRLRDRRDAARDPPAARLGRSAAARARRRITRLRRARPRPRDGRPTACSHSTLVSR